ncbi:hypothetical protein [Helicobacter sp. 11S02596-1]|nr:hypothetical protein [Helicobacter sp. 11S02596-1]
MTKTIEFISNRQTQFDYEMVTLGGGALSQSQLLGFGSSARRLQYATKGA